MARHDQGAHLYPVIALAPASISADNTPAAIDLRGFHAATLLLFVGVGGITFSDTNKVEFKLSHGDTSTVAEHAAVKRKDVEGVAAAELTNDELSSGIIKSLKAAHGAAAVYKFRYVGSKRYLSLLADFSGTHGSPTPIGAFLIKGHPDVSDARATN
jgi:hypothetical protein